MKGFHKPTLLTVVVVVVILFVVYHVALGRKK
jgi:hypothetical protein